jgi:hypothetical protein
MIIKINEILRTTKKVWGNYVLKNGVELSCSLYIYCPHVKPRSRDSFSRYSDGLRIGVPGFDSRQCTIILFSTASRQILGPRQPPMQWVPGAISPGD